MQLSYHRTKKALDSKKKPKSPPKPTTPISTARSTSDFTTVSDLTSHGTPVLHRSDVTPGARANGDVRGVSGARGRLSDMQRQSGDQALHFRNDSGTQINFWGAPPAEVCCC